MSNAPPYSLLLTFALKEEASPFQHHAGSRKDVAVVVTGMGQKNAEQSLSHALALHRPGLVLTCGFAGGLNPRLEFAEVVYSADDDFPWLSRLPEAGARPVCFHCSRRIVATGREKAALWHATGADAVEMESGVIRAICHEHNIPSATVRVISDAANENLPFDFNRLMDANQNLSYGKLALASLKSPGKISALLKLQKQTRLAAEKLAEVLVRVCQRV